MTASLAQAQVILGDDLYRGITQVEVFANSAMFVTPQRSDRFKLDIYRLDAMSSVQQSINQGLPQNEADARAWLVANEARIRRQVQPVVANAANGITLAMHYRIDRLPAIVVNRQTVVFGMTDVNAALAAFQRARASSVSASGSRGVQ
ncbi:TIGR03757 family integrating conjugative element protein [Acidovorax sp. SUPP2522]|uniref:TIGR03757 family integrating conjugative element protein n=1 Tax=unclassified Acidovorax TaxID=2684926 RepID=UPI00234B315A|nr:MULTISPECIES: TIGR03757 family integrating conjugative element protein [unclassified Acidovorax]WCM95487.1 TIGR03757 family integrating conjugative element protein [Acidovorax sp. GBBC 1281]GKT19517.1 TIGR03757 family integrating conjugative element protein [Acidovorax sp. SUPP2522]